MFKTNVFADWQKSFPSLNKKEKVLVSLWMHLDKIKWMPHLDLFFFPPSYSSPQIPLNVQFFEHSAGKDNWGSTMIAKLLPVTRRSLLKPLLLTQVFSSQQRGGYVRLWGSVRTETSGQPFRKPPPKKENMCISLKRLRVKVDRFPSRVQLAGISSCSSLLLLCKVNHWCLDVSFTISRSGRWWWCQTWMRSGALSSWANFFRATHGKLLFMTLAL